MKILALLAAVLLTGCATAQPTMPIPVRCAPVIGPDPDYPDTAEALAAADIVPEVQMLMAARALRMAREAELKAALAQCVG